MKYSRRDLGLLLPALAAAATASAQSKGAKQENVVTNAAGAPPVEQLPVMRTQAFLYKDIPDTINGKNKSKRMFTAKTHTGFKIESHMSDIAPGEVNHAPHQHLREEMMFIRLGTMELTINGKPYRLGPGDVGVIGSNEMHNAKNVGTTRAEYFICNIGRDDI
ncbi:MAG TPA: cupin domain-containing protein [Bryobacteraceae bacterium]|jgi:mannose-6-phosphate isomerase-like protein (cupin superfamily)|nr:cupin domain-containing protein [Bryobacteraceae bacterium]